MAGSSGVFLLLESGDRDKDHAARILLDASLKKLAEEIQLPVTVAKVGEEDTQIDAINQLESAIPFKVEFTVQTLSKADAKKSGAVLQQMLLGLEPDLVDLQTQPMVFLVYGRGRARACRRTERYGLSFRRPAARLSHVPWQQTVGRSGITHLCSLEKTRPGSAPRVSKVSRRYASASQRRVRTRYVSILLSTTRR